MSTTPTPETFAQKLDGIEAEHAADDDHPARKARIMDTTRQQLTPEQLADIRRRIDEATAEHQRIKADIDAHERQLTAAATIDLTMPATVYRQRPPLSRSDKAWLAVLVALAMLHIVSTVWGVLAR